MMAPGVFLGAGVAYTYRHGPYVYGIDQQHRNIKNGYPSFKYFQPQYT